MNPSFRRNLLPPKILAVLPLTLFFPVGIIYMGIFIFLLSLIFAGDYRAKWQTAKSNPLFWPIIVMSFVTCISAFISGLISDAPPDKFWNGFAHYQIYLFLLFFICVGAGEWQKRAVNIFYIGALYGATLYYINFLGLLPATFPFKSYIHYEGNKSIMLGIMLAIAASWILYEITVLSDRRKLWLRLIAFCYIVIALLLLTKTRTASLIFVLLYVMIVLRQLIYAQRKIILSLALALLMGVVWQSATTLQTRTESTFKDINVFSQGGKVSDDGNRMEIYSITSTLIVERPWLGHGIATWPSKYAIRAQGLSSAGMSTPHNDYLLYAAEMGLPGLAALLWIWVTQLTVAWKMGGKHGMLLGMLGIAIMAGGMFNAILRDMVFGIPFMILLAIPLAGVGKISRVS